jgi:hypothetical protein
MASGKCCALLYQLPRVAPMARGLAQRSSDESEIGHKPLSAVSLAARREESHGVKGNGILVRTNRQWVCFAIAGEGGVEVTRR